MKNYNIFFIFILAVFLIKPHHCETTKTVECPSFTQIADFSDSEEVLTLQHKTVKKLWLKSETSLSNLGLEFKNVLFDLAKSKVPFWRIVAYTTSEWILAYLPRLNRNPNFCSFSQMINATVAFIDHKDCQFMFKAIDDILTEVMGAIIMYENIGIEKSECNKYGLEIDVRPIPVLPGCHDDGFSYDFDKMWEKVGWEYPCKYREIVEKMFKSEEKIDKVMALMATTILSEQMIFMESHYSPELEFQLLARTTTEKIPQSCCEGFLSDFDKLHKNMEEEIDRVRESAKISTRCSYPK